MRTKTRLQQVGLMALSVLLVAGCANQPKPQYQTGPYASVTADGRTVPSTSDATAGAYHPQVPGTSRRASAPANKVEEIHHRLTALEERMKAVEHRTEEQDRLYEDLRSVLTRTPGQSRSDDSHRRDRERVSDASSGHRADDGSRVKSLGPARVPKHTQPHSRTNRQASGSRLQSSRSSMGYSVVMGELGEVPDAAPEAEAPTEVPYFAREESQKAAATAADAGQAAAEPEQLGSQLPSARLAQKEDRQVVSQSKSRAPQSSESDKSSVASASAVQDSALAGGGKLPDPRGMNRQDSIAEFTNASSREDLTAGFDKLDALVPAGATDRDRYGRYNVVLEFEDSETLERIESFLEAHGIKDRYVVDKKGRHRIYLGSFKEYERAAERAKQVRNKTGLEPELQGQNV